jgi:tetratricopeptide (TPR) repeat protein
LATISEALTIATQHHQGGRLQAAEQIYRQILHVEPNHPDALHLLGLIAYQVGRHEIAIEFMGRALQLKPDYVEAHNNLGIALKDQGMLDEAVACYRRALGLKPDYVEAHNNLGLALKDQGKLDEAIACYRQALALRPDFAEAHSNLGITLNNQEKLDEAVACYRRALALKPDYADAYYNLGVALKDQRKLDEAIACFWRALALKPDNADAHYNLGNALKDQGKLDEAVACYRRALAQKPDFAEAQNNLGTALSDQEKLDEAAACYRRALALKPDYAEAHWNHALVTLLTGDFELGWAEYEWRCKTKQNHFQRRNYPQPLWDGQPLGGKTILLHAEQGLGDTIQFIRYAPLVQERGGCVVVECQASLRTLFADCPGVQHLLARGDPLPPFAVQAPLLSLPWILGTTLDNIPACVPYLRADSELAETWRKELESLGGFKVGIVWQGNPQVKGDRRRSIPLRQYEALAQVEGVRLVSLQKGSGADQLHGLTERFSVLDLGDRLDARAAFMDTAAVMMNLDLIVTMDTAVGHLAGALGRPVWLALSLVPDWRWLLDREDSPWYPHHRLFRQSRPGDWSEVFERIASALRGLVATRTGE